MGTTVADVRYRWYMGPEARLVLLITACLLAFGLATVYSASAISRRARTWEEATSSFASLRASGSVSSRSPIFAKVDAELWSKYAWPMMLLSIVLLLVIILPFTESIAPRIRGSRRFLIGSSLQPSELGKIAVIVWTSMLVVKKGDTLRRLTKGLLPFLLVIGVMDVLVALEPDLSVAMMYTLMMGIMLFAGGVRIGHFVVLGIVAIPLLWGQMQRLNYTMLRMTAFFDPGSAPAHVSDQLRQSLIAVGSGQLLGLGFGKGRQQLGFLPLAYDDFIAGSIGEEWGFIGLALLILAFAAVRVPRLSYREESAIAVSSADGRWNYIDGRHHRLSAHRRGNRTAPDHRSDAAIHFVRSIQHGAVAAHDRNPREHRQHERKGDRIARD